jgi:hypothetical protein
VGFGAQAHIRSILEHVWRHLRDPPNLERPCLTGSSDSDPTCSNFSNRTRPRRSLTTQPNGLTIVDVKNSDVRHPSVSDRDRRRRFVRVILLAAVI